MVSGIRLYGHVVMTHCRPTHTHTQVTHTHRDKSLVSTLRFLSAMFRKECEMARFEKLAMKENENWYEM